MIKLPTLTHTLGYTMIELLIMITILGIMITLGTSSYRKTQERQALRGDVEVILEFFKTAQKEAVIGQKDCTGKLVGIEVSLIAGNSAIEKRAICSTSTGATTSTPLQVAAPTSSLTFQFRPLDGSTTLQASGDRVTFSSLYGTTATVAFSSTGSVSYVQE